MEISLKANKDGTILKFRSVNCLRISRSSTHISKASVRCRSQKYLFGKFSVKFYGFKIFFYTTLDGCVWSMRIILSDASYFRHSNKIHCTKASFRKYLWNYNKNENYKPYLGNKEQKLLFLVASQSDMHNDFDFACFFFFACLIETRRSKFFQPCIIQKEMKLFFLSNILIVWANISFYMLKISREFTIYRREGERGSYLVNSFLPLPPVLQTLTH